MAKNKSETHSTNSADNSTEHAKPVSEVEAGTPPGREQERKPQRAVTGAGETSVQNPSTHDGADRAAKDESASVSDRV